MTDVAAETPPDRLTTYLTSNAWRLGSLLWTPHNAWHSVEVDASR